MAFIFKLGMYKEFLRLEKLKIHSIAQNWKTYFATIIKNQ